MDQVVFDTSQRGTGTLAKLLRSECDVLNSPISSQIPIIQAHEELKISGATPAVNVSFIALNTEHPALRDSRVRKGFLNLAINRQNIRFCLLRYGHESLHSVAKIPLPLGLPKRQCSSSL